ncbi:unnamed protein product [Rhizophagus irregularis]|nr:unnamed protein product [Rhizophagus irregularis]CAB4419562.1 unnamed protein product [Rhizophagus irregularis]
MCKFLYGVRTKKGDKYSRASLKNAVTSISRHLKNLIPYWNYNLLDKNSFPKLHATLDGTLKEMKRLEIGTAKLHEEVKHILQHDSIGLEGNQHTFEIPFPSDIADKVEPNADIRKYISMRPPNCTTKEFYLGISNASG